MTNRGSFCYVAYLGQQSCTALVLPVSQPASQEFRVDLTGTVLADTSLNKESLKPLSHLYYYPASLSSLPSSLYCGEMVVSIACYIDS